MAINFCSTLYFGIQSGSITAAKKRATKVYLLGQSCVEQSRNWVEFPGHAIGKAGTNGIPLGNGAPTGGKPPPRS